MAANLLLFLRLLVDPAGAMSDILDRGSLLFASLLAVAVALLTPFRFFMPLLALAAIYVPGVLLLAGLIGRAGSLRVLFSRDYSSLLTCTAFAWSAAAVPFVVAVQILPGESWPVAAAVCALYFGVLMFYAIRTVLGTGNGVAVAVVSLSWIPLVAASFLMGPLRMLLSLVASPFFLLYALYFLRGEFSSLGDGLRRQQSLRRMLEAAAVNPHDGEAQYQIGLIMQQRRRYTEAMERFRAAIAIDPTETDAHFQLGRIAFGQKRYADALGYFQTVLSQDEKHSQSEVHRELGATFLMLGKLDEARSELGIYAERRPYDPQGLYYYGQALDKLGDKPGAREAYTQAIEAARTAPAYRRRIVAEWSRLSQRALRG